MVWYSKIFKLITVNFFFNLGCRAEKLVIATQGNQLYVAEHAIAK